MRTINENVRLLKNQLEQMQNRHRYIKRLHKTLMQELESEVSTNEDLEEMFGTLLNITERLEELITTASDAIRKYEWGMRLLAEGGGPASQTALVMYLEHEIAETLAWNGDLLDTFNSVIESARAIRNDDETAAEEEPSS